MRPDPAIDVGFRVVACAAPRLQSYQERALSDISR